MSVLIKRKKIEEYTKTIMEYVEVIWLYKMMRRTKSCLLILRSVFRGELCGQRGQNKNSSAVNRPKIGVSLQLDWYCLTHQKLVIFGE